MQVVTKEAKNKEEALNKALAELNAREQEVFYTFLKPEGHLFKKEKVTAITKYGVKEFIKDYLTNLAHLMSTKFEIEFKENDYGFNVMIMTDDNGIFIGKNGKNLECLQLLLRQTVNNIGPFNLKVNLDISDYKAHKERQFEGEIKHIASVVNRTKVDAKLDPMNSYKRRLVHNVVSKFPNLITQSEGEEPNRYVVIQYHKN